MKTRRAFLAEPGRFEIREIEETCGDGDVLVKVASCGLCNWELNFWKGKLNYYGYPHPLGHEYAGTVAEVGSGVKDIKVGDNVSCFARGFGGFSQYKALPASSVQKLAPGTDPKYALGEPQKCIITVLRALRPEAGDFGVVQGGGPLGLWVIMALGGGFTGKLIAVYIDDKKLALAKKYGAAYVVNSAKENAAEVIAGITGGRMADWVVEGTGVPALLNTAQDLIKRSGRGRRGLMSSHEDVCREFDFRKSIDRGLEIVAAHPAHSEDENDDFRRAVELINNGTFRVRELISHEWKLSQINEAFKALEHKPAGYLKGIVVPD